MPGSSAWTMRSPKPSAQSNPGTKRKCIASVAKSCCSATRPIPQQPSTAIAIAQSQKARSFELRAALALAKLYRATNRDLDAHAVLALVVEGFPPTQQFPELTEALTLLSAISP